MSNDINMKSAVISVSGGMDSTGLLLNLLREDYKEVLAISFDYGQKHKLEIERLQENLKYLRNKGFSIKHRIVDLTSVTSLFHSSLTSKDWDCPEGHYEQENMKETVVPNRNAIFSSVVYGIAQSLANQEKGEVDIALGVHSGDHAIYPDCRPEFYEAIMKAFAVGNWNAEAVSLYVPFLEYDKAYILRDSLKSCEALGLDFDTIFRNTSTSYAPNEKGEASGKTGSDVERIEAFLEIGRVDPVPYEEGWGVVSRRVSFKMTNGA